MIRFTVYVVTILLAGHPLIFLDQIPAEIFIQDFGKLRPIILNDVTSSRSSLDKLLVNIQCNFNKQSTNIVNPTTKIEDVFYKKMFDCGSYLTSYPKKNNVQSTSIVNDQRKSTVFCYNPTTAFTLVKQADKSPFIITDYSHDIDRAEKTIHRLVSPFLHASYMIEDMTIDSIISSPNFKLKSIIYKNDNRYDQLCKIDFEVYHDHSTKSLPTSLPSLENSLINFGSITLLPLRKWVIHNYELEGTTTKGLKFIWKGLAEYADTSFEDQNGLVPIHTEFSRTSHPNGDKTFGSIDYKNIFDLIQISTLQHDKSNFDIQAFGLLAPSLKVRSYRATVIGFALLSLSLVLFVSLILLFKYTKLTVFSQRSADNTSSDGMHPQ